MRPSLDLDSYFALPDTPSRNSPAGGLMVKILEKYPELTFDETRTKANEMIQMAAGRKNFRIPEVLTPEEMAVKADRLRAFAAKMKRDATPKTGKSDPSTQP